MSALGFGVVLFLPLLLPAAALALTALGVIVTVQAGRTLVCCGRELLSMAGQNIAMQRALRTAAMEYEAELRNQDMARTQAQRQSHLARLAAFHRANEERTKRLATIRDAITESPAAAIENFDDLAAVAEPIGNTEVLAAVPVEVRRSAWPKRVAAAARRATELGARLDRYTVGADRGLFATDALTAQLEECRGRIAELEANATAVLGKTAKPDTAGLERVWSSLSRVAHGLMQMDLTTSARRESRREAVEQLVKAREELAKAAGRDDAERLPGLELAGRTLDDALHAIERTEFSRAASVAAAVLGHLAAATEAVTRQRQQNLRFLIDQLKVRVQPLGALAALDADVQAWMAEYERIGDLLEDDLAAAWEAVTRDGAGLAPQGERLQQRALELITQSNKDQLVTGIRDTLDKMGYSVDDGTTDGGVTHVVGRRGRRRFRVSVTEAGGVAFKLDGFGDRSCEEAVSEFLDRLQRGQGIIGAWQQQFSLDAAVERLVDLLHESGLDATVEPTDDGATVVASGTLARPELAEIRASATYDGLIDLSQRWRERVRSGGSDSGADDWLQVQRDHLARLDALRLRENRR